MFTIDLSLSNTDLYNGLQIEDVNGRLNLATQAHLAAPIVGRNIAALVAATEDRSAVLLTGPMAVWAYLIVFHACVHSFSEVWYSDGRGEPLLIARHSR